MLCVPFALCCCTAQLLLALRARGYKQVLAVFSQHHEAAFIDRRYAQSLNPPPCASESDMLSSPADAYIAYLP